MKNSNLVKFSLTLVCAAVLSACGSSGGGSSEPAPVNPTPAPEVTPTPEVTPAPETETKNETTSGTVTGVTTATEATNSALSYGHKSVKKRESNLNVGQGVETTSKSSTVQTAMTIPLDPSLDTIVVATGNFQDKQQAAYLEDFDFRGNLKDGQVKGAHLLQHIHLTTDGSTTKHYEDLEGNVLTLKDGKFIKKDGTEVQLENVRINLQTRPGHENGSSRTKTKLMGTQEGVALVYQDGRFNYISTDETELSNEKIADTKGLRDRAEKFNLLDVNGNKTGEVVSTVAEVYGNKTFLAGNSAEAQPTTSVPNADLDNAPFLHKGDVEFEGVTGLNGKDYFVAAGRLNEVQYGRVTTKLDQREMADFREGLPVVDGNKTRIASFGVYGENGTEDHYFYRGNTGSRNALDTAALQNHYKSGSIQYNGHAVTYGLDHSFTANNGIPNALGYQKALVSGTHVQANIDLATNNVTGNLYDVWQHGAAGSVQRVENKLVDFNGTLNVANGGISGTSSHKGAEGTFNANVFGANAQELGGAVKSKSVEADSSWGAVFGAAAVQPTPEAPVVVVPPRNGLTDSTDGNNSTATGR